MAIRYCIINLLGHRAAMHVERCLVFSECSPIIFVLYIMTSQKSPAAIVEAGGPPVLPTNQSQLIGHPWNHSTLPLTLGAGRSPSQLPKLGVTIGQKGSQLLPYRAIRQYGVLQASL